MTAGFISYVFNDETKAVFKWHLYEYNVQTLEGKQKGKQGSYLNSMLLSLPDVGAFHLLWSCVFPAFDVWETAEFWRPTQK